MRYRRNADTKLRIMEREWASTGNVDLLIPINRERRRVGLPPHPDARVILANNALFEWVPRFAEQLLTAFDVYDEIDLAMHIHGLRELRDGDDFDDNAEFDAEEEQGTLIGLVRELSDEIVQLEQEQSTVRRAGIDLAMSGDFSQEYENLRRRYGVDEISLGAIPELPSDEEEETEEGTFRVSFFSPEHLAIRSRSGFNETREQIGWLQQVISRRALRIYRKALTYGVIPIIQILQQTPAMVEEWYGYELRELDDLADKIEIATNEILNVTQGFGPSPEAIELFTHSWYKDED